jgi:hypothetical protein
LKSLTGNPTGLGLVPVDVSTVTGVGPGFTTTTSFCLSLLAKASLETAEAAATITAKTNARIFIVVLLITRLRVSERLHIEAREDRKPNIAELPVRLGGQRGRRPRKRHR